MVVGNQVNIEKRGSGLAGIVALLSILTEKTEMNRFTQFRYARGRAKKSKRRGFLSTGIAEGLSVDRDT